MSDKFVGLMVTFEKEISREYLEIVRSMILSIKGVISVSEKKMDIDHCMAHEQAVYEIRKKLFEALK